MHHNNYYARQMKSVYVEDMSFVWRGLYYCRLYCSLLMLCTSLCDSNFSFNVLKLIPKPNTATLSTKLYLMYSYDKDIPIKGQPLYT